VDIVSALEAKGIQPSAQRVAVAEFVLRTDAHPSADEVLASVKARFPHVSRATVYNTLNLFTEKGLLRSLTLDGGRIVYDPMMERHHHFVDEDTGAIYDLPWDAFKVEKKAELSQFEVRELQVVVRGKKARRTKRG
jgi:Fe2+ or Zn2+ uptake regulation protein